MYLLNYFFSGSSSIMWVLPGSGQAVGGGEEGTP